jgi:DNA-binding LacI/PurR family transcriptional regulator
MIAHGRHSQAVQKVAQAIERDLERRRLMPGDRYYTSEEARRLFRVGKGIMNQALGLLADRQVLVRRQKAGTFVGPRGGSSRATRAQTIHVVLPADREGLVDIPFDQTVEVFRQEIPNASVQFSFFPGEHATAFVRDLVESRRDLPGPWGVLAVGCPHAVMDYLAGLRTPVVAFTSFIDERWTMPSIDTDRHQAGQLLADHLLKGGHKQIALMNFAGGSLGLHDFYDGVSEAMSRAALPHNALIYRDVPPDSSLVRRSVQDLMARSTPPTAFIARSLKIAHVVAEALREAGTSARTVEIVFQDHDTEKVGASPWVHTVPQLTFGQLLARAAHLLRDAIAGQKSAEPKVIVPVELRIPPAGRRRT